MHTTLAHHFPDDTWRFGTFHVFDDDLGDWYWCPDHPGATPQGPYTTRRAAYNAATRGNQ